MPAEDDIVQRVVLEGDKVVVAQFKAIGTAGQQAFDTVNDAASKTAKVFGTQSRAFGDVIAGLRSTKTEAEGAAAGMEAASKSGLSLATTLRLIGRATGVREISRLGGAARALGKAFEIALPAILIAGLAKLGTAGAKAASDFADLGASLKVTAPEMQTLQEIGNAAGLSFDELSTSMKSVDKLTKDTAENASKNTKEYAKLKAELDDTAVKSSNLAEQFAKVGRESTKSSEEFQKSIRDIGQASIDANRDFGTSLRKIEEQRNDIINGAPDANTQRTRQLRDLNEQEAQLRDKQTRDLQKSMEDQVKAVKTFNEAQEARRLELRKLQQEEDANIKKEQETRRQLSELRVEIERNATALDKLGINATDSTGKLKKAPVVLLDIARALGAITDPAKQLQIEQDLINAGIDRKLIPALRRGEAGFKALQKAAANINPGFTQKQIDTADKFSIAIGQVGDAVSALFKGAGIAVGESFIGLFESLRDLFIEIRPGVIAFTSALAEILVPALKLIVDIIRSTVVPLFKVLGAAFDGIANLINKAFGTSITGSQLFVAALLTLGAVLRGGIILIQLIIVAVGLLAKALEKVDWSKLGKGAQSSFQGIVTFATNAYNTVRNTWNGIIGFFTNLWTALASGATNVWTTLAGLAAGGAKAVINAWTSVLEFFTALWQGISDAGANVWLTISNAANTSVQFITQAWTGVVDFFKGIYNTVASAAQTLWTFVSDQAFTAVNFITGIFTSLRDNIVGFWETIKNKIIDVWNAVKDKVGALLGGGGDTAGAQGRAGGGSIHGPGGPKGDKIPIWASDGEFMMKTKAVQHYGVGFMHMINSLRFNPDMLEGFNLGGLVTFNSPQPRLAFAEGGIVDRPKGGGNTLNLAIDGQSFNGLTAPDDTFASLSKYATNRQSRSAGRQPSWKG